VKRLYETTFTVPALGNATLAVPLEDNNLDTVRIVVPAGHCGLTGLRILWGGMQVVPFGQGTFIVANDEVIDYAWDDQITADGLTLAGFNNDIFPHNFYLRWVISDLQSGGQPVTIVSPQLTGAPDAATVQDVADLADTGPDLTDTTDTADADQLQAELDADLVSP